MKKSRLTDDEKAGQIARATKERDAIKERRAELVIELRLSPPADPIWALAGAIAAVERLSRQLTDENSNPSVKNIRKFIEQAQPKGAAENKTRGDEVDKAIKHELHRLLSSQEKYKNADLYDLVIPKVRLRQDLKRLPKRSTMEKKIRTFAAHLRKLKKGKSRT